VARYSARHEECALCDKSSDPKVPKFHGSRLNTFFSHNVDLFWTGANGQISESSADSDIVMCYARLYGAVVCVTKLSAIGTTPKAQIFSASAK
jgi:hypothetical protein